MNPVSGYHRAVATPGQTQARHVKAWVREALALNDAATVMVTELTCAEPGCPPHETVMAILRPHTEPVQRKLPQRLSTLTREVVMALWMAGANAATPHHAQP